jgi:DNA-binding response OmpR family regulator
MRRGRLRVGELEVDPPSRHVTLRGKRVELSQKEFALLRTLASEPTRVFTKEELLRTVWGFRSMGSTRTLDSHACRLRRKLGVDGDTYVVNVWGVGYRLIDGMAAAA